VTQVKFNENGGLAEIKLADKNAVATTLLRSVGGLVDRSELSGAGGGTISFDAIVAESMALVLQRREAADDPGAQRFFMEHFVRVLDDAANLLRKSCLQ
jgi:hypothetical protein